jgi:hypothetical protein
MAFGQQVIPSQQIGGAKVGLQVCFARLSHAV